jgi:hypothetical protein
MPNRIGPGGPFLTATPSTSASPAVDDEDGWWAGNLTAIPRALAAASLATSVASNSFQYTEEIVPYLPVQTQATPSGQRAQHKPIFIKWDQSDDLPVVVTPRAFDEDGWQPPVTVAARIPLPVFDTEELPSRTVFEEDQPQLVTIVPGIPLPVFETEELPVKTVFEEDGQLQPVVDSRASLAQQANEELPIAPSVSALEESDWASSFYAKAVVIQPWNVDDDLPALVAPVVGPGLGGSYQQRAQYTIRLTRADQGDDLPITVTPAIPDEVDGSGFKTNIPDAVARASQSDEDFPTLVAPISAIPDEVEGPDFRPKIKEADGILWATEEEILPQPPQDEVYWQPYFTLQPTAKSIYLPDAEEFPAGNLFPLASEEYNILQMVTVPVPQPVIVTFGGDEEMGDFVEVEEVHERGAKWPVRAIEFLTKIKNRFYWFRDESELPKEEPVKAPAQKSPSIVAKVDPAIAEEVKAIAEVQSDAEIAKRKRIERNNEAIMKLFI